MSIDKIKKNDYIIYSSNGICLVSDIQKISFNHGESEKTYYILKPINDKNSTIYIPTDNKDLTNKFRNIITKKEANYLLETKISPLRLSKDRKLRINEYKKELSLSTPSNLLPLLLSITKEKKEFEAKNKKIAAIDRETFDTAITNVSNEFAFALKTDVETAKNTYCLQSINPFPSKKARLAQLLIRKLGSFIRLWRVILLCSDIRLTTSDICYASFKANKISRKP